MSSHKPGGPILFYTGNEGAIETFAVNSGFVWEAAIEFNAAVVFAEHRYYGSSMPFGSNSTKVGYLTAEQALADYALLIRNLSATNEALRDVPVIAIGGSYGGMLAAWFRYKYPNLIAGSIASSAPIWMFPGMSDCNGFYKVATDVFRKSGSENCKTKLAALWNNIIQVAKGPSGTKLLSVIFQLCDPLTDGQTLVDYLVDYLGILAMINYPYEASFIGALPAWPVKYFCENYPDALSVDDPLDNIRVAASAFLSVMNYTGDRLCINVNGDTGALDTKNWEIQTCMEMTNPMCSNGISDMFPPNDWDPDAYSDKCFRNYGLRPRMNWSEVQFWGKNLKAASNIVFSNGDLDPWSSFGVLDASSAPNCDVIVIPNSAHHLDLRAAHENDPPEVIDARKKERAAMSNWIKQWRAKT
ncbi:unnamed protein product [Calicophoron daubneyi]